MLLEGFDEARTARRLSSKASRTLRQQLITRDMSILVIDLFEPIQIEHADKHIGTLPRDSGQQSSRHIMQRPSVRQFSQRIRE